jgi:LysR family transcriptional regulator, hydrogen peroxide-inducible genes activator
MRWSPHPLSLRQLQYAAAVADTGSFRRAAERCHVSQPSLSAQIAELERGLGVVLFERSRRGVLVTTAGRELIERARRILVESDDLVEAAQRFVDPLSGALRIGVIPTIGPYLLPIVVPAIRRKYRSLTLIWIEDKTSVLVDSVTRGELDAALLALEADLGDLEHARIAKDPFVLAAPPDHRLAAKRSRVRPEELSGEPVLLLDDGHCFREQALAYCSGARAEELGYRATSLPTLAQMVASGAGVTLLPELAVPTEARRSRLAIRPFARPVPSRTIVLAWRRRSPLGQALGELAAAMAAAL